MVPIPGVRISQQDAGGKERNRNSSLFFSEPRAPPPITYGKKSTKPLSLTGNQFRKDVYTIPSDDEDDDRQPTDSDSLLGFAGYNSSAEDLEPSGAGQSPPRSSSYMYGESQSGVKPGLLKECTESLRSGAPNSSAWSKKGTAKPVQRPRAKPLYPPESPKRTEGKPGVKKVTKTVEKAPKANERKSRNESKTTSRRLPVNELFLVTSPADYNDEFEPLSSYQGIQTQDPIVDQFSSPLKRKNSPFQIDGAAKVSKHSNGRMTALREYLKTPKPTFKSIAGLQRKQRIRSTMLSGGSSSPQAGDGFNTSELTIGSHYKAKRRRKRQDPLARSFASLQLSSGPLPTVEFEPSGTELKVETQNNDSNGDVPTAVHEDELPLSSADESSRQSKRRVSFSDAVRESLIMAQLSSISAPARASSESEESDEDLDDDGEDEADDGGGDEDSINGYDPPNDYGGDDEESYVDEEESSYDQVPSVKVFKHFPRPAPQSMLPSQQIGQPDPTNTGVTLDFRQTTIPGQYPRTSLGRWNLMEVSEAIVEVPESDFLPGSYNLVREHQPPVAHADRSYLAQQLPRSILKNNTEFVPESTTRPEATAANTRRNSMVDVSESRYFADATDMLQDVDLTRHKIIPRRSSYFNHNDVDVLGSDRRIQGTSPESPDYTNASDLGVLRRTSEATWTSNSQLPTAPRDLKALTRSVSRGHGTLSQSARRRPSLPFHSPMKVS